MDAAIWWDLDACTDLAQRGCLLEDGDGVAFASQCDGCCETSETCSRDDDF